MKKTLSLSLIICVLLCCFLTACSGETTVDFKNAKDFEAALNAGDDLTGKIVTFTVDKFVPNSALGYNLQTGEHLNFVSSKNPGVKEGDSITAKVTDVSSTLGSYIISYEKLK